MSYSGAAVLGKHRKGLSWPIVMLSVLTATVLLAAPAGAAVPADAPHVKVIVREAPAAGDGPEAAVEALGGTVGRQLGIIDAFTATLPAPAVARLQARGDVQAVTLDGRLTLLGWESRSVGHNRGTMDRITDDVLEADRFWNDGFAGRGVGVALIDSGVRPVDGLTRPGAVVHGPDLSFESDRADLLHLDTFGHGTHMAGIIVGHDDGAPANPVTNSVKKDFLGVAPNATLISIKVADADGATDVSQVIAAIDWVVQHRNDMNIRVLNLSFGTNGTQAYQLDPLAYAAEVAWRHGIVVVVAAGNDGNGSPLRNPAYDPFVIAVGAVEANGSGRTADDFVPDFSNCGTSQRHVDVIAPGKSIISLRAPESSADRDHPDAVVDDRFFKGSGTSQAAAMVSGAAALLIDQRPDLTPDQVKALLMETAQQIPGASARCQGAGLINLAQAHKAPTPLAAVQTHELATGLGSLDAARGSVRVSLDGEVLAGEVDVRGQAWDGASWSVAALAGASWSGGSWSGASWSGASWSGGSWSGASWSGGSWSGGSWSGGSWSASGWLGLSWRGPAGML